MPRFIDKCPGCPVVAGSCLAQRSGHIRFCELVIDRPDYAEFLRREAENPAPVQTVAPTANVVDQIKRIKECPHFEKRSDCGCGVNWCRRDAKTVALNDCLACLEK